MDAVSCLNFIYNLLAYSRGVSPDSPCRGSVLSTTAAATATATATATTTTTTTIPNVFQTNEEWRNEMAGAATSKTLATAMAVAATGTATATTGSVLQQRPRAGGAVDQDSLQTTQSSPSKGRLNFLEGFRTTLRPRSPVRNNSIPIVAGSRVRLTADWGKLHAGEELEIFGVDGPGLIVCPVIGKKEEFWIPAASLVPNSCISRAWSFRPRRIDSAGESVHLPHEDVQNAEENGPPAILTIPCSIRATAGGVARLVLEVRRVDQRALVRWRKEGQPCDIITGKGRTDRYRLFRTNDSLCLEIAPCLPSDSGVYHCYVQHETGSCSAKIPLRIIGIDATTNAWRYDTNAIECDRTRANHGSMLVNESSSSMVALAKNLKERSTDVESEIQFAGKYVELEELGTGRFAKVCRAREKGFDGEVALKQISRSKQPLSLTRAEYDLLRSMRHDNIVRAFALFEDTPQPDIDTVVLELVKGSTLFAHLGQRVEYTEATVAKYTGQLLSALQWLHCSRKQAHLDLKPENILLDSETDVVKLIDFGEAVRAVPSDEVVPPVDLEFAAPELVLGKPTGSYTDIWAIGVFLYVSLSGLSPFLDDSIEETTANILKCDFCFPDEYFKEISTDVKHLLETLLRLRGEDRATAQLALTSPWFKITVGAIIPSSRMIAFIDRRGAHRSKSHQDRNSTFCS